jgi:hypothetical protein
VAPSYLHEGLIALFRERPALAPELMRSALHVALPDYAEARVESADLTQLDPAELRADLVILLRDGEPVLAIVLEVQLATDPRKRFTWPAYVAGIRVRYKCDACVLVVTPSEPIADWARQPIAIGPGAQLTPLVLGPRAVPVVCEPSHAEPELVVLSAIAHGADPADGPKIALAALTSLAGLDEERSRLYFDLVYSSLGGAARRALEEHMASGYEYQSDFAKKYVAQGEAKGRAEGKAEGRAEGKAEGEANALLHVLAARRLTVSDAQRARILACTDLDTLTRWIERAVRAETTDAVFSE